MMVLLIDVITILIPLLITFCIYRIYNSIIVNRYISHLKKAIESGDLDKVKKMKQNALAKQPKKMTRIFLKHGI